MTYGSVVFVDLDVIDTRRHILPDRSHSDETIDQINQWQRTCDDTHVECHNRARVCTNIDDLPTRLMFWDSRTERARLVHCGTDQYIQASLLTASLPPYLALSYRWGLRAQHASIRTNISRHTEIDAEDGGLLPRRYPDDRSPTDHQRRFSHHDTLRTLLSLGR